jgi:tetratricopeptide (TPR) repeat protein
MRRHVLFQSSLAAVLAASLAPFLASFMVACATTSQHKPTIEPQKPIPSVVTDATYAEVERRYWMLGLESQGRAALRDRLLAYLLARGPRPRSSDEEYEALIEHLSAVTKLFTPQEIADGKLPAALGPSVQRIVELGSPRGDEARVLSALLVLRTTRPSEARFGEQYRKIKEWGFSARAALSSPMERYEEGLVEVWEEHARLTPTPEVLSTLSRLYLERRNALIALFRPGERRMPPSAEVFEGVQHTAMSVAAVYLAHGDVASALTHLEAMGSAGEMEEKLIDLLESARESGADGSGALLDLARAYGEAGRLDVARGLCVLGLRETPNDARFYRCLAQSAAHEDDFAGAMAWYSEAVRLMPEERVLYDEILEVLSSLMEQGLFGSDAAQTRAIATRASEILQERVRRWPDSPPPVKPEDLYLATGIAEMNAGNASEAEARLRQSLAAKETLSGMLQLGLLLERVGRNDEAAELYRRALQQASEAKSGDDPQRAEILERLGDSLRMLGKQQEAAQVYEQGLAIWDRNLSRQKGMRIGLAHLRRGVLLGRLARRSDAVTAFERAMENAPELRETYSTILAYLAVSDPDSAFAHRVFRNAVNQLSLEPEWKVYFGLWLRMIAGRDGAGIDPEVSAVLADLSQGDDWFAKLARFASGQLDYEGLLQAAVGLGERTEAYFYEGARRLGAGDLPGARAMFEQVVHTKMVNFYEFAMAQELLAATGTVKAPEAATNAVPPAGTATPKP